MKKVCAAVILILSFNQYVFSQIENDSFQPPIKYVPPEEIVEWMDSLTTFWMDIVNIPGMVVSIETGDSIIMEKGYGYIYGIGRPTTGIRRKA